MANVRLQPGEMIDGFTVGQRLHVGGMATLWEVTHPDHAIPLVMKAPLLNEGGDPAAIVSFEMEQMLLPRLSGPHVPKFIAAGDFEARPYIVMERLSGKSLVSHLADLPLAPDEVAELGICIALALDDLHRQHVVHLDVKPSNVMFRPDGAAVLVDFGLSRHGRLPDLMEEEFRVPYGTAPYMAPEQVMGNRREPRSDLFALGVLLYFFATGVLPFGDPLGMRPLKRRIWRDPVPPRRLRPDLPPWLQETILRCLEVEPARRHPTAAQLALDLQHPDQIALTARAERMKRDSYLAALKRRFDPGAVSVDLFGSSTAKQAADAPIVAVAIDFDHTPPELPGPAHGGWPGPGDLPRSPSCLPQRHRAQPDLDRQFARCGRAQQARHAADRAQALGGPARPRRRPHHLPCAGRARRRRGNPRPCPRQPGRPRHPGRAGRLDDAQPSGQRLGRNRRARALQHHRGPAAAPFDMIQAT